jgi:arginyl-tRNA synthetase
MNHAKDKLKGGSFLVSIERIKNDILNQTEEAVKKVFGEKPEILHLGFPPEVNLGDFSVECFPFAKQFKKSPTEIAKLLVDEIPSGTIIQKAEAVGPYLNFKVLNAVLFGDVCAEITAKGDAFGNSSIGHEQRVMVEYLSPNTNKPLHLGHIRNGALGMSVSNLLEATGHTVIKANLVNDRGVHICKSMLAWQKWANGATPKSEGVKGDHFVGQWYVRYAQEAEKKVHLEEEIQEMLQKWEFGDSETIELWKTMNSWVYDGFAETYQKLGLEFDTFYYESDTYKLGRDIIEEGLAKKVFYQDDRGAIIFDLPEAEFGRDKQGQLKKVTVLRADGTSVYMTQDIGTALLKVTEHKLDRSIYVVGSEQNHHFQCLFKILESLGYPWAKGCYHLSYGMVYLPEGKMKSREGKIVDADDLIEEMQELATEEIRKRDPENNLSEKEIKNRAAKIGVGAIKFYLLRVRPSQDIHFDPEESISFEGFTGPYCQYA